MQWRLAEVTGRRGGRLALAFSVALAGLGLGNGCDVLNPSLVGTIGNSSIAGLTAPAGTMLITVLNTTTSPAAVRLRVTKDSGGSLDLSVPVAAADNNAEDPSDNATVVQDCDVYSIELLSVAAALPNGEIQQLATDRPPLRKGLELSCGKLVVITLTGVAPNLFVQMAVY